jgi:hypothetical protein
MREGAVGRGEEVVSRIGSGGGRVRRDFPKPSHFIGARKCRFGRTTAVNGFVISTVGEYYPEGSTGMQRLGSGSADFYETYVFRWKSFCEDPECNCGGMPLIADYHEILGRRSATEDEALRDHEYFVRWARGLYSEED